MTNELREAFLGGIVYRRLHDSEYLDIPIPTEDKSLINCEIKQKLDEILKIARFKCIERYNPDTGEKCYTYEPVNDEAKKLREQTTSFDQLHHRLKWINYEKDKIEKQLEGLVLNPYVYSQ